MQSMFIVICIIATVTIMRAPPFKNILDESCLVLCAEELDVYVIYITKLY